MPGTSLESDYDRMHLVSLQHVYNFDGPNSEAARGVTSIPAARAIANADANANPDSVCRTIRRMRKPAAIMVTHFAARGAVRGFSGLDRVWQYWYALSLTSWYARAAAIVSGADLPSPRRLYARVPSQTRGRALYDFCRREVTVNGARLRDEPRAAFEQYIGWFEERTAAADAAAAAAAAAATAAAAAAAAEEAAAAAAAEAAAQADAAAADEAEATRRASPPMPATAPTPTGRSDASAIDHLSVEELVAALAKFRPSMVRRVPSTHAKAWAGMQTRLTDDLRVAHDANDDEAVDRSLKWLMISHALVFRGKTRVRSGRRLFFRDNMDTRFDLWERGERRRLLELFVNAAARVQPRHRKDLPEDFRLSRAMEFLEAGLLSKCRGLLLSAGLGDMDDPRIIAQLDAKHPLRKEPMMGFLPTDIDLPPIQLSVDKLRKRYRGLTRLSGVGVDGLCNEHLICLGNHFESGPATRALAGHCFFANLFLNGKLPAWYYSVQAMGRMVALLKDKTSPPPGVTPAVRPVNCGNCTVRSWVSQAVETPSKAAGMSMRKQQFAVGVSSGGLIMFHALGEHMRLHPGHAIVKIDFRNAHNEASRAYMLRCLLAHPDAEVRSLARLFHAIYSPMAKLEGINKRSSEGGRQGCALATLAWTVGSQPSLKRVDEEMQAFDGKAMGYSDDMYIVGPPEKALAGALRLGSLLSEVGNMQVELRVDKSEVYCSDRVALETALASNPEWSGPNGFKIGGLKDRPADAETGFGLLVAGLPIGDSEYVQGMLKLKTDKICEDNKSLTRLLRSSSSQGLYAVALYCCQPLLSYEMQAIRPSILTDHLARLDTSLLEMAHVSTGIDFPERQTTVTNGLADANGTQARDLVLERLRLPRWAGGGGLRKQGFVAPAAWVGGLLRALPDLSDAVLADGSTFEGCHPRLAAALLGAGSFDHGNERHRFRFLVEESGSIMGAALAEHWSAMQQRAGIPDAGPDEELVPDFDILDASVHAAGLVNREDEEQLLQRKFQRDLTHQMEKKIVQEIRTAFDALPVSDRTRLAFNQQDKYSRQFVGSTPSMDCVMMSSEWRDTWHTFLGVPNPAFSRYVGKSIGNSGQVLDEHGDKLVATILPGGLRTEWHDDVKWAMHRLYQQCGIRHTTEATGLFCHLLEGTAWQALPRKRRQALIPDILLHDQRLLLEVKTIAFCHTRYKPADLTRRRGAVERRCRAVPREYIRKARKADKDFNNTAEGETGPVEARLMEFGSPPVIGISLGAFGEISKSMDKEVERMALAGAEKHWRSMGALTQAQAIGIFSAKITKCLGIATARGLAHCRLRGLASMVSDTGAASKNRSKEENRFFNIRWAYYNRHGPHTGSRSAFRRESGSYYAAGADGGHDPEG